MHNASRKILALINVGLTAVGILISIFFLFEVWHYRTPVTEKLQSGMDQFSSVLQVSDEGLVVIDQVVKNVYTSTVYLDLASSAFSQTVESSSLFMDSAGTFVGDNLLTTITNTQMALDSAQSSAKVIDNILGTLSRVPLIGINYNPAVPLNVALGEVSASLDPLHSTLKNFEANLDNTRVNMQEFSGQISSLNTNIQTIQANLDQAQLTIAKYRDQISSVKTWTADAKANLPRWLNTFAWIITLAIVWLILIQISILLQGVSQLSTVGTVQSANGGNP